MESEVTLLLHGDDLKSEETLSYITHRQAAGGEAGGEAGTLTC